MLVAQMLAGILAVGGIAYLGLTLYRLETYHPRLPPDARRPPVSLMVPIHGLGPRLEECLERAFSQSYPDYQIVFGLHTGDDPARPVIERAMAGHPERPSALVIDSRRIGANPKNCNLANMMVKVRHDLLVMVDCDVLLEPDFLAGIVAPLTQPGVGGVTCLYTTVPQPNLASRLCALYLNDWLVPSVLVDVARRDMDLCYGAAIAVTRRALDAIGGFEAMADAVAQDYVFGHELARHGFKVRLAPNTVATIADEPDFKAMFRHELRWNRAVRAVRPLDHLLSIFMNPLVPAGTLLLASWPWRGALGLIGLHLGLRLILHVRLRRRFPLPPAEPWWVPVREALNFAVWATALAGRSIQWGDRVMTTGGGLTMRTSPGPRKRDIPSHDPGGV